VVIKQGDIFWVNLISPRGSEPGYRHPHVVIQNNVFNARAKSPGNVLLRKGEGNLKRTSVVNISQIITVNKSDLLEKIGTLSQIRISEIVEGLKLLIEPREL